MQESISLIIGFILGGVGVFWVLLPTLRELDEHREAARASKPPPPPVEELPDPPEMPHYGRSELRTYHDVEWDVAPWCKPGQHPLIDGDGYYDIDDLRHSDGGHAVCVEHAVFPEEAVGA